MDVYTSDGRYLRALGGFAEPVIVSVTQPRADALAVSVSGSAGDTEGALVSVRRMLGTERDLMAGSARPRYARPQATAVSGVFEACANTILFQQVSLHAASAIMRRLTAGERPFFPRPMGTISYWKPGRTDFVDLRAELQPE